MLTVSRVLEPPPRLLVSVRNADELEAAILGGADIVDVKDPAAGPLGMASEATIAAIADELSFREPSIGLSVALGELLEWMPGRSLPRIPVRVRWAKMGLAGCGLIPRWKHRWLAVREAAERASGRPLKWIAVAYADAERAQAPRPSDVLGAAIESGCAGILLDTFTKSGGSLLDYLSPIELTSLLHAARRVCMPVALAGKVGAADVPWLCDLEPAIIGVRSVVCDQGNRNLTISRQRVADFKRLFPVAAEAAPLAGLRLPQHATAATPVAASY